MIRVNLDPVVHAVEKVGGALLAEVRGLREDVQGLRKDLKPKTQKPKTASVTARK